MKSQQIKEFFSQEFAKYQSNIEGFKVLLGGICIHLMLGTFYLWGGICIYVASYLHSFDNTVTSNEMLGVFPYMGFASNLAMTIGIKIARKISYRLTVLIGVCGVSATVFICSFVTNKTTFIILYALLFGTISGILYMIPIECCVSYFPKQKGKITGAIVAGYGLGTFFFSFITKKIVNPYNLVPDSRTKLFTVEVYEKVPTMLRFLAILYFILGFIGYKLLKDPQNVQCDQNLQLDIESNSKYKADDFGCPSVSKGIFSKPFMQLSAMGFCSLFCGMLMAFSYKQYGFDMGKDDNFLTLVGSLQSICNGLSRPFWGCLLDKLQFKRVYQIIIIIQLILIASIHTLAAQSDIIFLLWICLLMCIEGCHFAIFPAQTLKIFGTKYGIIIYGFVSISYGLSNMSAFLTLNNFHKVIGWQGIWVIGFMLSLISLYINKYFKQEYNWNTKIYEINDIHEEQTLKLPERVTSDSNDNKLAHVFVIDPYKRNLYTVLDENRFVDIKPY